jgi:hypothetical protein
MSIVQTLFVLVALSQNPHPGMTGQGAAVMGFNQARTAHHFYLYDDGGAIEVAVKDPSDSTNRDAIRSHLPHIAMMFGAGDFAAPMLVHETKDVPGAADLARLKNQIAYTYVETPKGGRVNIVTKDPSALAALHKFLTYQIAEHHTGDSTVPSKRK